jgi:hypothetical protein
MALLRRSKLPFLFVASQAHNRVSETRLQFAARYLVAVSDQEDDGLVAVGVGYGIWTDNLHLFVDGPSTRRIRG